MHPADCQSHAVQIHMRDEDDFGLCRTAPGLRRIQRHICEVDEASGLVEEEGSVNVDAARIEQDGVAADPNAVNVDGDRVNEQSVWQIIDACDICAVRKDEIVAGGRRFAFIPVRANRSTFALLLWPEAQGRER